jgi:DNA (cytosine-5)-methyltransferase 1
VRPRLLDLFCGAGGAAMGYHRAGFDVVGVDIAPQPNYPFEFHQRDALEFTEHWADFDAIHASPPCQHHSKMSQCRPGLAATYLDLIPATRSLLDVIGLPYVIENVPGSTVRPDLILCGFMLTLPLYRHRLFESNVPLWQPEHLTHIIPASKAGHWKPGTIMSVSGHVAPITVAREAMGGIDWMTRDELCESIPPHYTQFIGEQLLAHLTVEADLARVGASERTSNSTDPVLEPSRLVTDHEYEDNGHGQQIHARHCQCIRRQLI